jgi:hypothetical protein
MSANGSAGTALAKPTGADVAQAGRLNRNDSALDQRARRRFLVAAFSLGLLRPEHFVRQIVRDIEGGLP